MSNSTKVPRFLWKSSQTYKEKSDRKIALLMFFALKALFYKAFMRFSILFEISLEHTLEGLAVASFVVVFVCTERL